MWNLKDKVVIISGATNGIGKAAALEISKENPILVFTYRNKNLADTLVSQLKTISSNIQVHPVFCDFSSQDSIRKCATEINQTHNYIDVLVNNAGVISPCPILELTAEQWDHTMSINLRGAFLASREALRVMCNQHFGTIVNISSP